ncbi:MAG: tRNA (adenosine(37)-N6)-threonylcarbamoyltransferase complex ATPase subunit type 1 TsaE [Fimbriimonadales bacterium]|nr:tRNA (adenosine(37)-N6)-threonylcarbamoyltransferase complex ATPase subunit type 1 TsaE [Fimbriimonadales bacterium]
MSGSQETPTWIVPSPEGLRQPAEWLLSRLRPGDWVLLEGELGAGKTTLCRELLRLAGWAGPVRSPTFNLVQSFPTVPPMVHADLYRVSSERGLGLEDVADEAVVLVEWPDRLQELHRGSRLWRVVVEFLPEGRRVSVQGPLAESPGGERTWVDPDAS